jgi:hypothetical protein
MPAHNCPNNSPVQDAVIAGEVVRQFVVHHIRWHLIEVVLALEDVPAEGPVLVGRDERPLPLVKALPGWQRPVDAVRALAAKPAACL